MRIVVFAMVAAGRNFPTVPATPDHVADLLGILDLDVIVFQEIEEDETRRRTAVSLLKSHVDDIAGTEDEVLVLGDYNDEVTDVVADNVFLPFTQDAANFTVATAPLEVAGGITYLPFSRFYDHVVHTVALAPERALVVDLDALIIDYSYLTEISDHQPVVITFPW